MILIKKNTTYHLAHLYEHLFCTAIHELCHKNELFAYLDYAIIGHAYKGFLYVEMQLYTSKAKRLAKQIPTLDIDLSKASLLIALAQILAEEERRFESQSIEAIKNALREMHQETWQNINDIDITDMRDVHSEPGVFYAKTEKLPPATKLGITLALDPDFATTHRRLLPLFQQLATLMLINIDTDIAYAYGYYRLGAEGAAVTPHSLTSKLKIASGTAVDMSELLEAALDAAFYLINYDALDRMAAQLGNAVSTDAYPSPDLRVLFKNTLLLVGAKGWKAIATEENTRLIQDKMTITLEYNGKILNRSLFNNH